jgi:hypothetical protein
MSLRLRSGLAPAKVVGWEGPLMGSTTLVRLPNRWSEGRGGR